MDWKEFFKPSVGKVILFLILIGGLNYFVVPIFFGGVSDARILVGVPLGFYPVGSFSCVGISPCNPPVVEFSYVNFIIDLIFWYLISCLFVAWYKVAVSKNHKIWSIFCLVITFILFLILLLLLSLFLQ